MKKKTNKLNTLDKILLGVATFLAVFVVTMIVTFWEFQSVPDILITAVFGLLGSEVILVFIIWYVKRRFAKKYMDKDMEDDGR